MSEAFVRRARKALDNACVPYSEYTVGATLRTVDGGVYVDCSIESTNYSNNLHVEEVTIAEAVKNGHTELNHLVVTSRTRDDVTPCGICRQTLVEFCDEDLLVVCDLGSDDITRYTLGELLPNIVSLDTLEVAAARCDTDE